MQSLREERSPHVLASSSRAWPVGVSRVALAENLETAPFLDELLPSQDSHLLTGGLESMLRPEPQLSALNETLEVSNSQLDQKLKRSKRL